MTADNIYTGGTIITVNDAAPSAEALAVKSGKILAAGTKAGMYKTSGGSTNIVDLDSKTLIPGFIDGHNHFSEVGFQTVASDLLPPSDETIKKIEQLQQALRDHIRVSPIVKTHNIVIGMNCATLPGRSLMQHLWKCRSWSSTRMGKPALSSVIKSGRL